MGLVSDDLNKYEIDYNLLHEKRDTQSIGVTFAQMIQELQEADAEIKGPKRLGSRSEGGSNIQTLYGIPLKKVTYTVPPKQVRKGKRNKFNKSAKKRFLEHLYENHMEDLYDAGLSKNEMSEVKNGHVPNGYSVHHKMPIHGGGGNEFDNFVLIKLEPYHDDLHHYILDPQVENLREGDSVEVHVPFPDGSVFVPPKEYKDREKDNAYKKSIEALRKKSKRKNKKAKKKKGSFNKRQASKADWNVQGLKKWRGNQRL